MKLLTIAVPCYNSEAYMEHCIETLLVGGEEVEIIIVDDGSTDRTAEIADRYAAKYPTIVRAIHQENAGHGGAVNTGIRNASGEFMKIVDSDDWVNEKAYKKILHFLRRVVAENQELDLLLSNYVHEKVGETRKKVMHYHRALPINTFFTWDDVGHFNIGQYILMHSVIYRTRLLRECGLELPKHTFYVDNIYVYYPMPYVHTMYYMDVMFYRYFIGRNDQSVNEEVMIGRIDQQIRVNKLMFDSHDLSRLGNKKLQNYMYQYLEIVTAISTVLLLRSGTPENLEKKKELWQYMKTKNPAMYRVLRHKKVIGRALNLPGKAGREAVVKCYGLVRRIFGY